MGRKRARDKKQRIVRIPNPDAPVRERLDTPSHKVHRSKKQYRRTPKHRRAPDE